MKNENKNILHMLLRSGFAFLLILVILIIPIYSRGQLIKTILKPPSISGEWIGFWGSLVSSIIGAIITIIAIKITIEYNEYARREEFLHIERHREEDGIKLVEPRLALNFKYSKTELDGFITAEIINVSDNYALDVSVFYGAYKGVKQVNEKLIYSISVLKPDSTEYTDRINVVINNELNFQKFRITLMMFDNDLRKYTHEYWIITEDLLNALKCKLDRDFFTKPLQRIEVLNNVKLVMLPFDVTTNLESFFKDKLSIVINNITT